MLNQMWDKVSPERTPFGLSSGALKQAEEFLRLHSLSEILPYQTFDEETQIFMNRDSLGFVLETLPMAGFDPDKLPQMTAIFQHLMPLGSNLQCLLVASPRVENWIGQWEAQRRDKSEVLRKMATKRAEYLRQLVPQEGLRTFRLIISYSLPRSHASRQSVDAVMTFREQLSATLQGFGMPVWRWTATDLLRRLDELLNPEDRMDDPELHWNPHDAISNQLMSSATRIQVEPHQLVFGEHEKYLRLYTARLFPTQWYQGHMSILIGDPFDDFLRLKCPFFISYSVHICDEKLLQSRMHGKCRHVEKQAYSPVGQYFPSLKKEAADWRYVRTKFEEGQRLVRTRYQVGIYATPERINQEEQTLLNLYRSQRWELSSDKYIQLPSFVSALPMTWGEGLDEESRYYQRTKTTLTHEPSNLMPFQGEWHGTKSPGVQLVGRRGQLFWWNPFDNNEGNFNTCVVGKPGSGKSFFMQELLMSCKGMGARVFVLDVGRSFKKMTKYQKSAYLEFSRNSDICINPFSVIPLNNPEEMMAAVQILKPIISLMAAPKMGTDDDEDAAIEKAILSVLKLYGNQATITELADHLRSDSDEKLQRLGNRLFPFTKDGSYGRWFNGPANIDLSEDLVVVELDDLNELPDLQTVVVQMIILQITDTVYLGNREKNSLVILDEAWDLLRAKQTRQFIEKAARRLRKYLGGLVVGTQSVNDFYENPGAQAAFDNSDWLCLLAQKDESIDQLKISQKLSMDPYMERTLRSLRTDQGKYAEVLVKGPVGYAVGRLIVDPFSKILYSTKAEEFAAVEKLQAQGMDIEEAVMRIAKETFKNERI